MGWVWCPHCPAGTPGLGYRFSAEDAPLWRDYQSLGPFALHRILSTKIVPYFDTAT